MDYNALVLELNLDCTALPSKTTPQARLFSMYRKQNALPYCRVSYRPTTLGNYIHILVFRVVKGLMVRRGRISSRREDYQAESNSKEGGDPSYLYPASVPQRAYYTE